MRILPGHLADFARGELVKLSEIIAEKALSGELAGVFMISIRATGQIDYSTCLVRPSEALGMMEVAKEAILRKFVLGPEGSGEG